MGIRAVLRRMPFLVLGREGERRPRFLLEYVTGKEVLDVGVVQHTIEAYDHPAWIHRHVAAAASYCVGIDYLKEGIEYLRSKGLNVVEADAEAFNLSRTFDVVVAGEIVEHLSNVGRFLESARKHLRPDGRLLLTTPNPWFWGRSWQAWFGEPDENPEHTAWLTVGTLREILRRHGFEVEKASYGSGEERPWWIPWVPRRLCHTSIWLVARPMKTGGARAAAK